MSTCAITRRGMRRKLDAAVDERCEAVRRVVDGAAGDALDFVTGIAPRLFPERVLVFELVVLRSVYFDDALLSSKDQVRFLAGDLDVDPGEFDLRVVECFERQALGVRARAAVRDVGVADGAGSQLVRPGAAGVALE